MDIAANPAIRAVEATGIVHEVVVREPSRISLPSADEARDATGYERGTITPFGARGDWPVLADASIAGSGTVSVGGGQHGVAILLDADDLLRATAATLVDVAHPA